MTVKLHTCFTRSPVNITGELKSGFIDLNNIVFPVEVVVDYDGEVFVFESADSFGFPHIPNGEAMAPFRTLIECPTFWLCARSVYAAGMVTSREICREHECAIEEMPLGAELIAINNGDEWDNFTFPVRRIEVSDDTITLLSGYAGGYSKIGKSYAGEFNIKRGTKVRYSTK